MKRRRRGRLPSAFPVTRSELDDDHRLGDAHAKSLDARSEWRWLDEWSRCVDPCRRTATNQDQRDQQPRTSHHRPMLERYLLLGELPGHVLPGGCDLCEE